MGEGSGLWTEGLGGGELGAGWGRLGTWRGREEGRGQGNDCLFEIPERQLVSLCFALPT